MIDYIPTPQQFRECAKEDQLSAYERLFEHWLNKGVKKRALAERLSEIEGGWSSGAEYTNSETEAARSFVIQYFWKLKHDGTQKVRAKVLDKAQSDRYSSKALDSRTVGHWLRALNKAWNAGGWEETEDSFASFNQKARAFRSGPA